MYFNSIVKVGMEWLVPLQAVQKIGQRRNKRVLVPYDVSRWPEAVGVGMSGPGHQHSMTALHMSGIVDIENLQPVKVFEIEAHGALGTVNLQAIPITAADGITCRFKGANTPVGEAG